MANLFKPLFDDIYAFGQNSTNFATIGEMITGSSGSNQNFTYGLDSNPDYVNAGWSPSLNANGDFHVQRNNPVAAAEPWHNSVNFSENHTVAGNFFVYTGLLSTTGNSGEYVFGDMTTGLQLAMSDNTYFEDFGVAAGVATTSTEFFIPTNLMGDDSRYVIAVIPEPGTLLLVGLVGLAALAGLRLRRG